MVETNVLVRVRANISQFMNVMKQPLSSFRKMNTANVSMINTGAKLANNIRNLTHGMRGFRMEMLGVMFFGMGMQRFFQGLLKPALDLVGVFDLWRITLQVLFLPIALVILQFMIPLFNWFMRLDESTKLIIGGFVVFGVIIGTLTFLIGMLSLGLGSIILAFGVISPFLGAISKGFLLVSGVITTIIGITKLFKGEWSGLGLTIIGVGLILMKFNPMLGIIITSIGLLTSAIILLIQKWKELKNLFSSTKVPVLGDIVVGGKISPTTGRLGLATAGVSGTSIVIGDIILNLAGSNISASEIAATVFDAIIDKLKSLGGFNQ
mgnify:CR=1 FL=1